MAKKSKKNKTITVRSAPPTVVVKGAKGGRKGRKGGRKGGSAGGGVLGVSRLLPAAAGVAAGAVALGVLGQKNILLPSFPNLLGGIPGGEVLTVAGVAAGIAYVLPSGWGVLKAVFVGLALGGVGIGMGRVGAATAFFDDFLSYFGVTKTGEKEEPKEGEPKPSKGIAGIAQGLDGRFRVVEDSAVIPGLSGAQIQHLAI